MMDNAISYELDGYGWALEQASLLRQGRLAEADIENIAEEIEAFGKTLRGELVNRLTVVVTYLLRWQFQPNFRGPGWRLALDEQRLRLAHQLEENPSLQASLPGSLTQGYRYGLLRAMGRIGLPASRYPSSCPWSCEQVLAMEFFPE